MLHDSKDRSLFPKLEPDVLACLREHGQEITLHDGELAWEQGDTRYSMFVVLDGQIRVTKQVGDQEFLLVTHEPGEFTGEISMLTGAPAMARGRASGETRVMRIPIDQFRKFVSECPAFSEPVLAALAKRFREVDSNLREREKLVALGKLSAGLAHELNNPAAAARRAMDQLQEVIDRIEAASLEHDGRLQPEQRTALRAARENLRKNHRPPLEALDRADEEERMCTWLDDLGVKESWVVAPTLVGAGVRKDDLAARLVGIDPKAAVAGLEWLEQVLRVDDLLGDARSATGRISELVKTIKAYSHMDEAPYQEIDLHEGIDSTLKMFASATKKSIEVVREYDRSMPKISAYASELNQVWTNLIDNAIDAMDGNGKLTVRTVREPEAALVEIEDTGSGIPEDIQGRIFEPFFTTKSVGKGTGLGLDIVYRIVTRRHHGQVRVYSQPGQTRFQVRLPFKQSAPGKEF
jgi:signal transduction histidine kinase